MALSISHSPSFIHYPRMFSLQLGAAQPVHRSCFVFTDPLSGDGIRQGQEGRVRCQGSEPQSAQLAHLQSHTAATAVLQTVITLIVSFAVAMIDLGTMALADKRAHFLQARRLCKLGSFGLMWLSAQLPEKPSLHLCACASSPARQDHNHEGRRTKKSFLTNVPMAHTHAKHDPNFSPWLCCNCVLHAVPG